MSSIKSLPLPASPSRSGNKISTGMRRRWNKRRGNLLVHTDDVWTDGDPDDIVIPVMGPTGVGKSTFISCLVQNLKDAPHIQIGVELESCTTALQPVPIRKLPNSRGRVVVVDTPGFDDTYTDDSEILRRIAVWLTDSYIEGMKLGGVIYLHDISRARMLGTTRMNLEMFQHLCGADALHSIILVTTKWSEVEPDVGDNRQSQLESSFWKDMMGQGARTAIFKDNEDSAQKIVNLIVDGPNHRLKIQKELAGQGKVIPGTHAGKTLSYSLDEIMKAKRAPSLDQSSSKLSPEEALKMKERKVLSEQIEEQQNTWKRLVTYIDYHLPF